MQSQLSQAGLETSVQDVSVIWMISGGNRSLFMCIMNWLLAKNCQGVDIMPVVRDNLGSWDTELMNTLLGSRAVKVNGSFKNIRDFPKELVKVFVEGSALVDDWDQRRDLTVAGLITPAADGPGGELYRYEWDSGMARYRIAGVLRARYYLDLLAIDRSLKINYDLDVKNCADLLARVLPFMSFDQVVHSTLHLTDDSIGTLTHAVLAHGLPPEDAYNHKIIELLCGKFKINAQTVLAGHMGKPDVFVRLHDDRFVLELVHYTNLAQHIERFNDPEKVAYSSPFLENKALVCLCTSQENVDAFFEDVSQVADADVDLIALMVDTSHVSYTMSVVPRLEHVALGRGASRVASSVPVQRAERQTVVLMCDHVAKKINAKGGVESAQHLHSISVRFPSVFHCGFTRIITNSVLVLTGDEVPTR